VLQFIIYKYLIILNTQNKRINQDVRNVSKERAKSILKETQEADKKAIRFDVNDLYILFVIICN